jgi:hypothetical protein
MRTLVISVGLLLSACSATLIGYEWQWRPEFQSRPPKPGTTIGFEESTHLPEQEVKAAIDQANSEVDNRYGTSATLRFWGRSASWSGFALTSLMTVIVGFYGGKVEPGGDAGTAMERILKEQQRSRGVLRLAGALIALATLPNLFAQRLDADANNYASSGRTLQEVLIDSSNKMYDKAMSPRDQGIALAKLKAATRLRW